MMEFLAALEHSRFSQWVLASGSIFAYPSILFMHTIGMAMVAGISAVIDLRLLGLSPKLPIKPLERLYPLMWVGFAINLLTGSTLMIADATTKLTNPDFYVKMIFVFSGVAILYVMQSRVFGDPELDRAPVSSRAKSLAWISLVCWVGAVTCGRLLAYVGPVSGLTGLKSH
ncbi:MAG: hypothetical protein LAP40_16770 [Acidobacteriia bacterium]|nr:hypothetical protein [Terriglobia bacterium]